MNSPRMGGGDSQIYFISSRARDMENLKGVFDANDEYLKKHQNDLGRWKII